MKRKLIWFAALAFGIKLGLALTTYGTNDVLTWEADVLKLHTEGATALYREGVMPDCGNSPCGVRQVFNHPPFITHVLRLWATAADLSGVPFRAWIRLACALADLATLWLLLATGKAESILFDSSAARAMALSPVSILISGFHGNTDPIMMCLLVLSIYLIATQRSIWVAGAAFGLALNIKVVPLIFLPAILLYLGSMRDRLVFTGSAATVFIVGSLPVLAEDPALVVGSVFGYNSLPGSWGVSIVLQPVITGYAAIGKYIALGAVLVTSIGVSARSSGCPLLLRCGLAAFVFLFLAPGFGVQYLAWVVPWVVALPWRRARWHYAVVCLYATLFYGAFSRWRWQIADTMTYTPPAIVWVGALQTACWVSMGALALACAREALRYSNERTVAVV